ncbi:MAG TPA: hypothetical protein VEA59_02995 [Patescibacteria group bacterium]|nr:hypothetical protein [Patescibacteria group bacterium]
MAKHKRCGENANCEYQTLYGPVAYSKQGIALWPAIDAARVAVATFHLAAVPFIVALSKPNALNDFVIHIGVATADNFCMPTILRVIWTHIFSFLI